MNSEANQFRAACSMVCSSKTPPRCGRRFTRGAVKSSPRKPWFQTYFESFAWYKADPKFSETSLSPIEKGNHRDHSRYEKKAVSAMSVIEG